MPTPYLDIQQVQVYQADTCVFRDFSAQFWRGQNTCVLGPNGAGKTTLLKLLTREIYPVANDHSFVKIDGSETAVLWDVRKKIGFVSHDLQIRYDAHVLGRDVVINTAKKFGFEDESLRVGDLEDLNTGLSVAASRTGAFAAPPLRKSGPLAEEDVVLIARGLGVARQDILQHAWCDNGPNWRGVMLDSAEQVLALKPDASILEGLDVGVVGPRGKVGVVGSRAGLASAGSPAGAGDDIAFEVRAFFPGNNGMAEDPVTGSLNAALAQWLIGAGLAPDRYVASQGTALGRAGRVHVERSGDDIWIGGASVTCIDGTVRLGA